MKVKIISDSSCDIWSLDHIDFATAPLTISTEEKTYIDDESINVSEMLDYLAHYRKRSYTSCPSISAWMDAFGDADELYVITLTSGLSGTYNSALSAKQQYHAEHPDAKVFVYDTLSTASEQLLILEKIVELKEKGYAFDDVCAQIKEYSQHTRLFFAFQSLHNFAQNGRVPKLLAQAIGVLVISIIGTASQSGTVEPIGKCRGKKKVIQNLLEQMENAGYKGGKVNISHVENSELAEDVMSAIKRKYPQARIKCYPSRGLVAYYAERGGIIVGCEC